MEHQENCFSGKRCLNNYQSIHTYQAIPLDNIIFIACLTMNKNIIFMHDQLVMVYTERIPSKFNVQN